MPLLRASKFSIFEETLTNVSLELHSSLPAFPTVSNFPAKYVLEKITFLFSKSFALFTIARIFFNNPIVNYRSCLANIVISRALNVIMSVV
jgi:hypothetical protein